MIYWKFLVLYAVVSLGLGTVCAFMADDWNYKPFAFALAMTTGAVVVFVTLGWVIQSR